MVSIFAISTIQYNEFFRIALEGFSEALAKELDPKWNIKVRAEVIVLLVMSLIFCIDLHPRTWSIS